jgi:hypothetical protein
MDEIIVGVAVGVSVLVFVAIFITAHYRCERLRTRIVNGLHGHRLHEFTKSKY